MTSSAHIPTTEAEGRSRFLRLAKELLWMNANSEKPKGSAKHVDAAIREAMTWPPQARRGFTAMISRWMVSEVLGFGHALDEEIDAFAVAADQPYLAELDQRSADELDRIIARDAEHQTARKALKRGKPPAATAAASAPA